MNRRRRRLITPPNRQVVPRKLMKFCVSTAFLPRWINECVATCFHLTKLINSAFALSFFVCFHLTRPGPLQRSGFRVTTHEQHIHNRYFTVLPGGQCTRSTVIHTAEKHSLCLWQVFDCRKMTHYLCCTCYHYLFSYFECAASMCPVKMWYITFAGVLCNSCLINKQKMLSCVCVRCILIWTAAPYYTKSRWHPCGFWKI